MHLRNIELYNVKTFLLQDFLGDFNMLILMGNHYHPQNGFERGIHFFLVHFIGLLPLGTHSRNCWLK